MATIPSIRSARRVFWEKRPRACLASIIGIWKLEARRVLKQIFWRQNMQKEIRWGPEARRPNWGPPPVGETLMDEKFFQ